MHSMMPAPAMLLILLISAHGAMPVTAHTPIRYTINKMIFTASAAK